MQEETTPITRLKEIVSNRKKVTYRAEMQFADTGNWFIGRRTKNGMPSGIFIEGKDYLVLEFEDFEGFVHDVVIHSYQMKKYIRLAQIKLTQGTHQYGHLVVPSEFFNWLHTGQLPQLEMFS